MVEDSRGNQALGCMAEYSRVSRGLRCKAEVRAKVQGRVRSKVQGRVRAKVQGRAEV